MPKSVSHPSSLLSRAGVAFTVNLENPSEEVWIDVIQKMDAVYAELVENQVELEQKNAALEDAQQLIANVFASMTDVLAIFDRFGRIQRVNLALEKLTGRHESELLGHPLPVLFVLDSIPVSERILTQLREKGAVMDCEASLSDAKGAAAPLAINCSARFDHKGRFIGGVMTGRPLGELRRAYKKLDTAHRELQEAQQHLIFSEKMAALGRLVAGVAHELNNPISFVFANMHALKKYALRFRRYMEAADGNLAATELSALRKELKIDRTLADMEPLIEGSLEGATRASEIVQDLRRFSSGQAGPIEECNLARMVQTAVSWVVTAARAKPDISFDLPSDIRIRCARGAVHQILVNLIQNALDAMENQASPGLDITAAQSGDFVSIGIRDHGPGIPTQAMQKLFEPFFTTKPPGKGLGLGLYLSYGLAGDLGGRLFAANHPDGGAIFTLSIPVARHAA
jgi:two-component system sensor histidine kinase HupT/HoxJ